MKLLSYKDFKNASKFVIMYKDKTRLQKIIINLLMPYKYYTYKKYMKELRKNG